MSGKTGKEESGVKVKVKVKVKKESHMIKKASTLLRKREPVIIYTHSPRVIHTHPTNFMQLVQKLTGLSPPPPNGRTAAAITTFHAF
ncbi:hypothetical protein Fmac_003768 [Flemingia macrophylla]|uniref:VQ domain-containing protein n=1 Tax=Flemingia macrophylla TaxID=520843 RepID=A0ABD1N4C4_9FABA